MSKYAGVQLVRRPVDTAVRDDFAIAELDLPQVGPGEVEVANLYFSVDPYMRNRMNPSGSYLSAFELGEVMPGRAVGRVTKSKSPDLAAGDLVEHNFGWRTAVVAPAGEFRKVPELEGVPASAYLGILGWPGWTAWIGIHEIAQVREGDTIFVSAASGAVGNAAGQFAKLLGASTVIGSTGSDEKAQMLTEKFGFDHAFNYRDRPVFESLQMFAPDGLDVYYDNVGGEHLQAAWDSMKRFGRLVICGGIGEYNGQEPAGLKNMRTAIRLGLTLKGFALPDHPETLKAFEEQVSGWIVDGKVKFSETIYDGLENSIDAFRSLFSGDKVGKVLVSVGG